MATAPETLIGQLPIVAQLLVYGAIGIGVTAIAFKAYFSGFKSAPVPSSKDVVLTGGTIADMEPVRQLVEKAGRVVEGQAVIVERQDRLIDRMDRMIELAEQEANERRVDREVAREVEREVERRLREGGTTRRRAR